MFSSSTIVFLASHDFNNAMRLQDSIFNSGRIFRSYRHWVLTRLLSNGNRGTLSRCFSFRKLMLTIDFSLLPRLRIWGCLLPLLLISFLAYYLNTLTAMPEIGDSGRNRTLSHFDYLLRLYPRRNSVLVLEHRSSVEPDIARLRQECHNSKFGIFELSV